MRLLTELYNHSGIPNGQREWCELEIRKLLAEAGEGISGARYCANRLWRHYDAGGISSGRSWRSCLLEKASEWLDVGRTEDAKTIIAALVARYYDYGYINRQRWFDYSLEGMGDLPLTDRIIVTALALVLEVKDIPTLEEWDDTKLYVFMHSASRR